MKLRLALLAVVSLLAMVPVAHAASTTGSVAYSVQVTQDGTTKAATVTETVSSSPSAGQSVVSLAVQGAEANFTYSHFVNSSLTLFPYLPAITGDNYTYSGKSGSVTAKISQDGTSQVSFQGKSYTLTDYDFSATATDSNGTQTISGKVSTFPSDLVYSATASFNGTQASATLTSTTLSLSASTSSPATQAASAGLGISLAVGAVAISLGVKLRNKPKPEGPKPDHWVD